MASGQQKTKIIFIIMRKEWQKDNFYMRKERLLTEVIKLRKKCFDLSHRRSTTVSLETRNSLRKKCLACSCKEKPFI